MYVCDMTHSHTLYNMCAARIFLARLKYMCDITHTYVWWDSSYKHICIYIQYEYRSSQGSIWARWRCWVRMGLRMSSTTLPTTTLPSAAILAMYIDTREWLIDFRLERIQRWTDVFDACNECITNSMFDMALICPKTFLTPLTRRLRVLVSGRERISVCVCVRKFAQEGAKAHSHVQIKSWHITFISEHMSYACSLRVVRKVRAS